jgi:SAM-dependent methyltransferase
MMNINQHNDEIQKNLAYWQTKPILRKIYREFYQLIAAELADLDEKKIVEIGSGVGSIKEVIPDCLRTDLFPNPWLDQVENIYALSFNNEAVSNLILFDVFHHLRYPGTALKECWRVLAPHGRIIIFEPGLSLLGFVVYGLFHPEPIAITRPITWFAPENWSSNKADYYAAQGNASRIFFHKKYRSFLKEWKLVKYKRITALAYVASGGYSKKQMYPDRFYPVIKFIEKIVGVFPFIFATRLLIVLEKREVPSN